MRSHRNDSSYRLVQLFQEAAKRYDAPTTTLEGARIMICRPARSWRARSDDALPFVDGSDHLAHTPEDTSALMDPEKIRQIGTSAYLTLLVLCRETEY